MSALVFAAPLALVALIALPALYFLLRLTPPPPRRLPLPTLSLVRDLLEQEREPARTPWWLLVLRLAAAAAIILAVAGPRWQPPASALPPTSGPVMILLDDGWAAAPQWKTRIERASALLNEHADRPFLLVMSSDERPVITPETASSALARLLGTLPKPWRTPRETMFDAAKLALNGTGKLTLVWISDGITTAQEQPLIADFIAEAGNRLSIIADSATPQAITETAQNANGVEIVLRRGDVTTSPPGFIRVYDDKSRLLGETSFLFDQNQLETRAKLALPLELLNEMSRVEIAGQQHAGAIHLMDAASRRRRVALISGETVDTAQPLVSARYFVARALQPYSDLREPPRGVADPISRALDERPDVLVLADIGTLSGSTAEAVARFVEAGGMLIRFAGPGLAAASDDLLPVRLRRGGRILGGALSWDKPQKMAAFPDHSPFAGLSIRPDIRIDRQVLAEPDSDLTRASWAMLDDGTPLVTAAMRGKGRIVLFHVTGDTSWSNLPLSGLFVDMLRRSLLMVTSQTATGQAGANQTAQNDIKLAPRLILDGFGALSTPSVTARPVDARHVAPASRPHPPGFYGPAESSLAVNTITAADPFEAIPFGKALPLASSGAMDLRPWVMVLAAILLIMDALAVAILTAGGVSALRRKSAFANVVMVGLAAGVIAISSTGFAQQSDKPVSAEDMRSALKPRLAYVITGDARVDEASRTGLFGLTQVLAQRTSIQLDDPIGVDPARNELVFYPMLYWPLLPNGSRPQEAAIKAIDAFMKNGGTILFDTRDAFVQRSGGQPTPETRTLRSILATLDIPALEPVPSDHVLTKTFYLLDRMTGRYMAGDTWVEAVTGTKDANTPARAGDRVSPIIITSNDLASAWAVDRLGQPLFPLVPGAPRQREFALRTGVNLIMYVMTGNYKADQVHVPALLERLGQ